MVIFESKQVSKTIMDALLERKLENYDNVIETLDEHFDVWKDSKRFSTTVEQFKKVARRPELDIYLADHLLKYKLDFQMYQFRKKHRYFFQRYFCARIMASKAIAA